MRAEMRYHKAVEDLKTKQLLIQDHEKKYKEMQIKWVIHVICAVQQYFLFFWFVALWNICLSMLKIMHVYCKLKVYIICTWYRYIPEICCIWINNIYFDCNGSPWSLSLDFHFRFSHYFENLLVNSVFPLNQGTCI